MSAVTVKLAKPITAHGEEVAELTLREPTTGDIMELGSPTLLIPAADGESVGVEIRQRIIGAYITRLAGIPMSSVKSLSLADWQKCIAAVMGFFNVGDGET